MDNLLVAINAKYIHTGLSVHTLANYLKLHKTHIELMEFTINHQLDFILRELYLKKPKRLFLSTYIWNIELIKNLIRQYKKIAPDTLIVLGGPEVSFDAKELLLAHRQIDIIIYGEGEVALREILKGTALADIKGIVYRENDFILSNPPAEPIPMDEIPFPYADITKIEDKIFYYETSRGCPFRCSYCLSSTTSGVRYRSLPSVFHHLSIFLNANVRQVKFVDRTFNAKKSHYLPILKFIKEHDNGITNFHFEIAADLLDDEVVAFFGTVRDGLFQLEVGVQSTNLITLEKIDRKTNLQKLFCNVEQIRAFASTHQHLDLIVGLPYENIDSFKQSFNDVYARKPEQLQIGFLKVLKGSLMHQRATEFGIIYSEKAPYEVLCTSWISFDELLLLKTVEDMIETFYNSGRFAYALAYLVTFFPTPYDFYFALASFYYKNNLHTKNHSKDAYYTILFDFYHTLCTPTEDTFAWICKYDMLTKEKIKKLPHWLTMDLTPSFRCAILSFYEKEENIKSYLKEYTGLGSKIISRTAHIEVFPFNIPTLDPSTPQTVFLFNYKSKTINELANVFAISL